MKSSYFLSFFCLISDNNICMKAYCDVIVKCDIVIRVFLATQWYLIYIFKTSISDAIVVKSPQLVSAVERDPRGRRTESKWMWKDGGEADGWDVGMTLGVFNYKFVVVQFDACRTLPLLCVLLKWIVVKDEHSKLRNAVLCLMWAKIGKVSENGEDIPSGKLICGRLFCAIVATLQNGEWTPEIL